MADVGGVESSVRAIGLFVEEMSEVEILSDFGRADSDRAEVCELEGRFVDSSGREAGAGVGVGVREGKCCCGATDAMTGA